MDNHKERLGAVLLCLLLTACATGNLPNKASDAALNVPAEDPIINGSLTKTDDPLSLTEQSLEDCSVMIGEVSISLFEDQRGILSKLDEAGLEYSEFSPDDPAKTAYDSYISVNDVWVDVYFQADACVRIRMTGINDVDCARQTARGLHPRDSYAQMVELYGESFEKHVYTYKGINATYSYSFGDYICEFGFPGMEMGLDYIYNLDVYTPDQSPIYAQEEEVIG